jgi:hypothetical protein
MWFTPFFGEGERRTVAGNLNCFDLTEEQVKGRRRMEFKEGIYDDMPFEEYNEIPAYRASDIKDVR